MPRGGGTAVFTTSTANQTGIQLCSECDDHPSTINCFNCHDIFCSECFQALHKKGNKKNHSTEQIKQQLPEALIQQTPSESPSPVPSPSQEVIKKKVAKSAVAAKHILDNRQPWPIRAQYIPLRLTNSEQKEREFVEAALNVSEYTDKVDVIDWRSNKKQEMIDGIKEIMNIIQGLVISTNYKVGQDLITTKNAAKQHKFFQHMFEVGRRYKIINPDKMRDTYGKLIFALMDAQIQDVQRGIGMKCVSEVETVAKLAQNLGIDSIFRDPLLDIATSVIYANQSREQIRDQIRAKDEAVNRLINTYTQMVLHKEGKQEQQQQQKMEKDKQGNNIDDDEDEEEDDDEKEKDNKQFKGKIGNQQKSIQSSSSSSSSSSIQSKISRNTSIVTEEQMNSNLPISTKIKQITVTEHDDNQEEDNENENNKRDKKQMIVDKDKNSNDDDQDDQANDISSTSLSQQPTQEQKNTLSSSPELQPNISTTNNAPFSTYSLSPSPSPTDQQQQQNGKTNSQQIKPNQN
ncbi:MAG: hypothetical protein EZS28_023526, partial [Streblomastix strix]